MPIVNIQLLEGRSEEKVKEVIRNVTETVCHTLEVKKESVRVIVTEIPKTHWGIGGVSVSDIPGR
ncbi:MULTISPECIES: 4-oxalocrotonate tautomerase [Paenibacillus]|uniref:Tautomerase n=1 Tax=Paenibacillus naphthalenovorans TaxID=162209 RepID=A0A0U2MTE7_9BACL|nr:MULTISPECIES: 4-oxalocrotonate tautomerase [Paenibacillus]ALS20463.1 4-oxalocrotonate tautomerase [Paenibacillus naphthalenovorans]NTZ18100.1 4-oxalocrotonate tautomerase [Paenibacillus sp. JMULE4]GCL73033.1 4-oxalocrotonate tautomerase [Paenibacillus naphthalenovorans]SDI69509.1 4-oxalocrotonate tautomerase [Paenibacillus naphthalenovorans]